MCMMSVQRFGIVYKPVEIFPNLEDFSAVA